MPIRKIIEVDSNLCNACGLCIPSCAEGALYIEDNTLKIREDKLCDGLGACLGKCPRNALHIIEREADEFSEHAVEENLRHCPSAKPVQFLSEHESMSSPKKTTQHNWPVKLSLLSSKSDFLQNAHLLLAADCSAFACSHFHERYATDKVMLILCPRLENKVELVEKLTIIFQARAIKSIDIIRMEVPCCVMPELVAQAQEKAETSIPVAVHVLARNGQELLPRFLR